MLKNKLCVSLLAAILALVGIGPRLSAQAQDSIELRFIHIYSGANDNRAKIIQTIADAYIAKHPNIKITLASTTTDYIELFNAALLAAQQGNAPHIVQVEEGLMQLAADSDQFVPVGDLASSEVKSTLDDVNPAVLGFFTVNNKLWGMPWNISNPLLYYNKGMFKDAGLDPNKPPTTFAEVMKACDALMAKKDELKLTACINMPMVSWFTEQWVAMQNAPLVNNDNGRSARATEVTYTSPAVLTVANFYKDLAAKKYFNYSGKTNDYQGEGLTFLGKRTAMTINSTAGLSLFMNFSKLQKIDLGVAALPKPSDSANNGGTVGGASLWITKNHPDAELKAAADFIFFLTATEGDIQWHKSTGYLPIRQSSTKKLESDGWFKENPNYFIAVDQLRQLKGNTANAGAVVGPSDEVRNALIKALQSIVDNGEDPVKALEAAKVIADKSLADYNAVAGK